MTYAIHSSLIVSRSGLILVAWKYFVVFTAVVPCRPNVLLTGARVVCARPVERRVRCK